MDLYNTIIVTIWLTVIYAIWAATAAGDPGYGQAAFLIAAIAGHLFLRKLKSERPIRKDEGIKIPEAEFHVDILEEDDKYVFSEKSYRKIIWLSTILSILSVARGKIKGGKIFNFSNNIAACNVSRREFIPILILSYLSVPFP